MSDLPPGFVLGAPQKQADDLPPGFVVQGAPAEKKKFGLGDTWPAQLAKSVYSAVTLPGDVYTGKTSVMGEDGHTNPEVINRSAELASIATPMSPAARSGVGWAGALKTEEAPAPTQEALAKAASNGYDNARALGVELHPAAVSGLGAKIGSALEEKGINGELAPKTFSILNKVASPPADSVATVSNLETLRRAFSHAASDFSNPTEQLAARRAKDALADYMAAIPDSDVVRGPASQVSGIIKDANGNYAAAKRSQQLAEAIDKAGQDAASANSGANVGNRERTKLKQIYQNDRKSAGYSDEELAQMDDIIRGTRLGNITRTAGNALGGGGGLGAVASAAVGGAATAHAGGVGAVAPVIGYALKKYSDHLGQREIEKLGEMIRKRSPLASTMPDRVTGSVSGRNATLARALIPPGQQQ